MRIIGNTGGSGGGGGGNDFKVDLTYAGTAGSTSATYVDITDMVNQTVAIPTAGDYLVTLVASTYNSGVSYFDGQIQLLIDNTTAVECPLIFERGQTNGPGESTHQFVVTFTAGNHDIRPQWKRTAGTGTLQAAASLPWTLTVQG